MSMTISLTPQFEAMVRQRVESGRYSDASEVVQEALRLLQEREKLDHLQSLLAVGLKQSRRGEIVEFTPGLMENIKQRAHERFLRDEEPDPDVCP
jgi:antitoxin ParD1/3/4